MAKPFLVGIQSNNRKQMKRIHQEVDLHSTRFDDKDGFYEAGQVQAETLLNPSFNLSRCCQGR